MATGGHQVASGDEPRSPERHYGPFLCVTNARQGSPTDSLHYSRTSASSKGMWGIAESRGPIRDSTLVRPLCSQCEVGCQDGPCLESVLPESAANNRCMLLLSARCFKSTGELRLGMHRSSIGIQKTSLGFAIVVPDHAYIGPIPHHVWPQMEPPPAGPKPTIGSVRGT